MEEMDASNDNMEVKKLQELVKKLELQNAELLRKQCSVKNQLGLARMPFEQDKVLGLKNGTVIPVDNRRQTINRAEDTDDQVGKDEDGATAGQGNESFSTLDEFDLIDVDQLELSDDDSWLCDTSDSLTPEQKAISPYKWLRSDVDDLTNTELQNVKRALVRKIESLIQASNVNSNQTYRPLNAYLITTDRNEEPCLRTPLCARLSLGGNNVQPIDTRTFTRPKKSLIALDLPVVLSHAESPNQKHALTPPTLLTDVTDIHTMARLQEECLRQSSPPQTPRRNSVTSTSSHRSAKSLMIEHDTHEDISGNYIMQTSTDSQHDESPKVYSSQSSVASVSPTISPQGSQYLEETRNTTSGELIIWPPKRFGKRNLPNLPRPFNGISSSPRGSVVASNCDIQSANERSTGAQRYSMSPLRKVGGIPRSSSPATRLTSVPTRRSSPQIDDGNTSMAATGGLASRIPKPRQTRSAIPTRATSYNRTAAEESWKDGCY